MSAAPPRLCDRLSWIRLNGARPAWPDRVREAVRRVGVTGLLNAAPEEAGGLLGVGQGSAAAFLARARRFDVESEVSRADRMGVSIILHGDPEYPGLLGSIPDAPLVLYVAGRLGLASVPIAFVGSRRPTAYGLRMARRLCGSAAARGAVVVSGMARGIDTTAHQAALEKQGETWAVLGSGLGHIYPPENRGLFREISSRGACISEFPLDTPPLPENFPWRNRIVSGLSWATVVVEGKERSGSLITARLAAEQGRDVFAVPGPADSVLSGAPHRLIAAGAFLASRIEDIIEVLPPGPQGALLPGIPVSPPTGLARKHHKILELLGPDTLTIEEVAERSGIDISGLSPILFQLELENLIRPIEGQRYARK